MIAGHAARPPGSVAGPDGGEHARTATPRRARSVPAAVGSNSQHTKG